MLATHVVGFTIVNGFGPHKGKEFIVLAAVNSRVDAEQMVTDLQDDFGSDLEIRKCVPVTIEVISPVITQAREESTILDTHVPEGELTSVEL
jgi:hypothetical protein